MKIVFAALHFGYFRNFESAICALAVRGHQIHLVAEEAERFGGQQLMERLSAEHSNITWGWLPDRTHESWLPFAQKLRHALECVRFLDPGYERRPKLRRRAGEQSPRAILQLLRVPLVNTRWGRAFLHAALTGMHHLLPRSRTAEAFLSAERPDVLLLASLTYARSQQADYLRAARVVGIRSAACVMGFDHLSSKALLDITPDRVIVWNDTQRQEAVEMHRIPAERVMVTGAQCYDQWFDRKPSRSREELCRALGFEPTRPLLLYVCSALSPDPHESVFVLEWISEVRASADPRLRASNILIRPHPERAREWSSIDLSALPGVMMHGRNPIDAAAKADYFDALYHSSAVIGLVTSAFIEAGIVGRPVLTLLLPAFRSHQEGMRHFEYLVDVEGGLLQAARSFGEHLHQLSSALDAGPAPSEQTSRFLKAFVRPRGLDVPATPIFVESVERLATVPAPRPASLAVLAFRPIVSRLALAASHRWCSPLWMDAYEIEREEIESANRARKQEYMFAKDEVERRSEEDKQRRLRVKRNVRRRKEWRKKWRVAPRKVLASIKGRVKEMIGTEAR